MYMTADYVTRFCGSCKTMAEHTKLSCMEETVYCCVMCQTDEVVSIMRKSYVIVSMHDSNHRADHRRKIVVEVQRKSEPNELGETENSVENIMVHYHAYRNTHFTASVSMHPSGSNINHIEAAKISKAIRAILGKECV